MTSAAIQYNIRLLEAVRTQRRTIIEREKYVENENVKKYIHYIYHSSCVYYYTVALSHNKTCKFEKYDFNMKLELLVSIFTTHYHYYMKNTYIFITFYFSPYYPADTIYSSRVS